MAQIQIDPNSLKDRVCVCGEKVFMPAMCLKEIPALMSNSQKAETLIINVGFVCRACGEILPLRPEGSADAAKLIITN